jgi:hypothetical protein
LFKLDPFLLLPRGAFCVFWLGIDFSASGFTFGGTPFALFYSTFIFASSFFEIDS